METVNICIHITHTKKQSWYKIEDATLIMKCIAPAYTYHIQKQSWYKIEDATESASKSRSPTSGTRPVSSVVLDTNGRAVDRLLMKNVKIFCLTAFHTLSLLYCPLLHFPSVRSTPAFSTPAFSTPAFSAPPIMNAFVAFLRDSGASYTCHDLCTYLLTYLLTGCTNCTRVHFPAQCSAVGKT